MMPVKSVLCSFSQCDESVSESHNGCARVEPFAGRKSPNMFAFLLSKHRRLPLDVQPAVQRCDFELSNPVSSKLQR